MRYLTALLIVAFLLTGCVYALPNTGVGPTSLPTTEPPTTQADMPSVPATTMPVVTEPATTAPAMAEPTAAAPLMQYPSATYVQDLSRLPNDQVLQICKDYCTFYSLECEPQDVKPFFISTFEDAYVLIVDVPDRVYLAVMAKETVGVYTFCYDSSQKMEVYYQGGFYSLSEAYREGYLSDDDVKALYEKCSSIYPQNYQAEIK